ncbi:MAG TPA: dihydroorotase [Solirubrobacterales bacterium]|nr:dihydroorotase [Solirubrobacterales bacterium]
MSSGVDEIGSLDWRGTDGLGGGDLLVRRAHALDPRSGLDRECDLLIRAGRIAEIVAAGDGELRDGGEEIDAAGLHAFPGFFDPHVHLRTPGQEYREDIESGTRAAAAGGYCGIVAMANTDPVVDDPAIVTALRERAAAEAVVPTGFVATVTRGMAGRELSEMAALREAGALGFSDDGLPIADAGVMRRALQYQRLAGGTILLHEEDPALSGDGVMGEGAVSAALGLAGVPDVSESTMIARDGALCRYEDARAHVQHLSARSSVEAVAAAREAGVRLSAELTPHHLVLTDEEVRSLDARFKMNPPLRTEDDRQALIEALRSGIVGCIGTDHAPHAGHEKEVPFEVANMGVTGLETAFAALYTELVLPGIVDLGLIVERMGAGAAIFDLEPARIEIDAEADIALVDLDAEWEAGADGWESRSANSCFAGRMLRSRPVITVVAGAVAYRRREFTMKVAS